MNINEEVKQLISEIKIIANQLRQSPELSGEEYKTSAFLKDKVKQLHLPIETITETAFIAILDTGRPGKTIGLRTDIDGLPINESKINLVGNKKVISQNPGLMHACGHDMHMSILLGAMKILVENKDQFDGKIIFIFESGEETGHSIKKIIKYLKPFNIDAIYGNHVYDGLDIGKVILNEGPVMSGFGMIDIEVFGKEGHSSRPDQAINPIIVGSQMINTWSNLWVNQLDANETITLAITEFHCGNAINIIPNKAEIRGNIRYLNKEQGQKGMEIITQSTKNIADMYGANIKMADPILLDPVTNDENYALLGQQVINDILPNRLVTDEHWLASESFAYYSQIAPTVFALVGIKNDQLGTGSGHHTEKFDVDLDGLYYGITAMVGIAIRWLELENFNI